MKYRQHTGNGVARFVFLPVLCRLPGWLCLFLFPLLCIPLPLGAQTITLGLSCTIEAGPGQYTATARVTNQGEEAAHNLAVDFTTWEQEQAVKKLSILKPGRSQGFPFSGQRAVLARGVYPARMNVRYQDQGGQAASALHVFLFANAPNLDSQVHLSLLPLEMGGVGRILASVNNSGSRTQHLSIRLHLPGELLANQPLRLVSLEPGQGRTLVFDVSNYSALPGSIYPSFLAAEYDHQGVHYAGLAQSRITMANEATWLGKNRSAWVVVFFALLALGLGTMARNLWKRRKESSPNS